MKKEVLDNVQRLLAESDKAYVRLIREYAIVDHTPGTDAKVRNYIKSIKDTVFEDVNRMLQTEKESIVNAVKVKPGIRDTAGELRRNSELVLMKSAIDGANNNQLKDIAAKYANTEYEEDFRVMIQPRIKAISEDQSVDRFKNMELVNEMMATLDQLPSEVAEEVASLESIEENFRSMLYFNDKSFNIAALMSEEGRIPHGNWSTRSIDADISNANENFNPLGESRQEPLVVTERSGTKYFKTIHFQYNWEEQ